MRINLSPSPGNNLLITSNTEISLAAAKKVGAVVKVNVNVTVLKTRENAN